MLLGRTHSSPTRRSSDLIVIYRQLDGITAAIELGIDFLDQDGAAACRHDSRRRHTAGPHKLRTVACDAENPHLERFEDERIVPVPYPGATPPRCLFPELCTVEDRKSTRLTSSH